MLSGIGGYGQFKQTDEIRKVRSVKSARKVGRNSACWADTGKIARKVCIYPERV